MTNWCQGFCMGIIANRRADRILCADPPDSHVGCCAHYACHWTFTEQPMRASRRGMVDLIVMIVMIVFLLGMATLAWLTYDKAQKERSYLAALREIPAKQRAEIDSVRARYADLSSLIGFKGHADFTSPDEIAHLLEEGAQLAA